MVRLGSDRCRSRALPSILTVTLNPTVDLATSAPAIVPELKLRCASPQVDPGGGGINVSRAIRLLGGRSTALVAIGGAQGARLLELLTEEGIATVGFQGPGETRLSLSVMDLATKQQFRFVMPGPEWSERDVKRALDTLDQATGSDTLVVLSGSQPPGVAKTFPAILGAHIHGRAARVIVDTSGPALHALVEQPSDGVHVLRMDGEEAEELARKPLTEVADTATFARGLVARGVAQIVIVARGADGSVLAAGGDAWHAVSTRPVPVVSKVGAGDSFVGAFTLALARGDALPDCLALAVAAASAAVMSDGTRLCDPHVVACLRPEVAVRAV
jgi:6-phosphofructokinase 2